MNLRLASFFVLNLIHLLGTLTVSAHEGGHHDRNDRNESEALRTWTIDTNSAHLHGTFVSASDYHAQNTYPYLNGGFFGEVTSRGGQVDPQPRAEPIRPDLRPLRDATITGFNRTDHRFELQYDLAGRKGTIRYVLNDDGGVDFTFQDPSGKTRTESYRSKMGKPFLTQTNLNQN